MNENFKGKHDLFRKSFDFSSGTTRHSQNMAEYRVVEFLFTKICKFKKNIVKKYMVEHQFNSQIY